MFVFVFGERGATGSVLADARTSTESDAGDVFMKGVTAGLFRFDADPAETEPRTHWRLVIGSLFSPMGPSLSSVTIDHFFFFYFFYYYYYYYYDYYYYDYGYYDYYYYDYGYYDYYYYDHYNDDYYYNDYCYYDYYYYDHYNDD